MSNKTPQALMGNVDRGLVFILSAPAGTGKTTLVQMLVDEFDCVKESVSLTTRRPRDGEVDGEHYHFLSREEFEQRIAADEFLEHVQLFGDYYGTSKEVLREQQQQRYHVVLTIDTQGALQLKDKIAATHIFVSPPSLDEAYRRLVRRKTESPEVIEQRIARAEEELALAEQYDYNIVNDDLEIAYQVFRSIVIAEEHRVVHER